MGPNTETLLSRLVGVVVEKDLSPVEFVSLLKRYATDFEAINFDNFADRHDLSAWSPLFLPAVRTLVAHPESFDDLSLSILHSSPMASLSSLLALSDDSSTNDSPPATTKKSSSGARNSSSKRPANDDDIEYAMPDDHDESSENDDNGSTYSDSPRAPPRKRARVSASRPTASRATTVQPTSSRPQATAGHSSGAQSANLPPPVIPQAATGSQPAPAVPYYTPSFPPGRNLPGFIDFGVRGVASSAQGNHWPIDLALRDQILVAEVDGHGIRGNGISFEEVLDKYSTWKGNVTASTLRGRKRFHTVAAQHRRRDVTFEDEHVNALRDAIPDATDSNGNIKWMRVREAVIAETGRPFGGSTLRKQWEKMNED